MSSKPQIPPKHKRAKNPQKAPKTIADKLSLLNLRQVILQQGAMVRDVFFENYDNMVNLCIGAVCTTVYSELYRLAHPGSFYLGKDR